MHFMVTHKIRVQLCLFVFVCFVEFVAVFISVSVLSRRFDMHFVCTFHVVAMFFKHTYSCMRLVTGAFTLRLDMRVGAEERGMCLSLLIGLLILRVRGQLLLHHQPHLVHPLPDRPHSQAGIRTLGHSCEYRDPKVVSTNIT